MHLKKDRYGFTVFAQKSRMKMDTGMIPDAWEEAFGNKIWTLGLSHAWDMPGKPVKARGIKKESIKNLKKTLQ